ncbi:MAG: pyruvate dehydrogenase complex dihydrolipoamide acetyltransferase [Balneolales bacterium]
MAIVIEMPKLSDTMEEGVIAKWNVKEGDKVEPGDVIAEVETDKATMDLEAFDGGTVLKILAQEGDTVPLGEKLMVLGDKGEDVSDLVGANGSDKKKAETDTDEKADEGKSGKADKGSKKYQDASGNQGKKDTVESAASNDGKDANGRVKASPLARKMAEERGIDLSRVKGSGPKGRVIKADVEQHKEGAPADKPIAGSPVAKQDFAGVREDEDVKVSQMRKSIGKRLAESKFTSPHFYETIDIDMKQAVEARTALNEISDIKISFNDLVLKACSVALKRHPWVNASWLGDVIRLHGDVNVAVAVAVDDGLLTPVLRHADQKGLREISVETKELAGKARDKKLQPEDWEGSTFTISNLGMFGIEEFTAIINPSNVSILAVGAIRDVPVVEEGQIVPGKRMKVTLSSDHRVVDGAKAAEFLNTVRQLLENPASMLL